MQIRWMFAALAGGLLALPVVAQVSDGEVSLRSGYRDQVHYTTYRRGGITEEIYTSEAAVAAGRAGEPFPEGTVITMDDFRNGSLYRILVMEKRAEWEDRSRAGGWLFAAYGADGTFNPDEKSDRCEACHASQAQNDYVFTRDRME